MSDETENEKLLSKVGSGKTYETADEAVRKAQGEYTDPVAAMPKEKLGMESFTPKAPDPKPFGALRSPGGK